MTSPDRKPISARAAPRQERAQATYERLLDIAAELLGEVGIERISTNLICARAGVTPPALYRYFADKYAVLEALGRRLMARQNAVLEQWIARHADRGPGALREAIGELMQDTARVTASEPGAVWVLRALHATPRLSHIRLESHRHVTGLLVDAYAKDAPDIDRGALWQQIRLLVELGFAADQMLQEEDRADPRYVIDAITRVLRIDVNGAG